MNILRCLNIKIKHFMRKITKTEDILITPTCEMCGKQFSVKLGMDRKIPDDVYYGGVIRLGIGNWVSHKAKTDKTGNIVTKNGIIVWEKCIPWYKELKYRLLDFKRLILCQYKNAEYWECSKCYSRIKEENDDE